MFDETPVLRLAARVLLVDSESRLLLLRFANGDRDVWITPGGGLEPGESFEGGALRELWEETGLREVKLGPCVWMRTHVFPWNGTVYKQQERFYIVRTEAAEIARDNWTTLERDVLTDVKWWTLAEIQAADAIFAPHELGRLLTPILRGDYPVKPIVVGV